jgi:hypothetical protein
VSLRSHINTGGLTTARLIGANRYAALWKSPIWRIQLVSGFHLGKIWAAEVGNTSPVAQAPGVDSSCS